jgi:putative nucleotidyltransferase with HDIG domain
MSKIISRLRKMPSLQDVEKAFSAGLLHDLGKLIIISHLPHEYLNIKIILEKKESISEIEVEAGILQFTHADLGSYMAAKWNLPEEICDIILNHHSEEAMADNCQYAIIHLADHLAHQNGIDDKSAKLRRNPFYEKVWGILGLDPASADQMLDLLKDEYAKAETFIKMAQGTS